MWFDQLIMGLDHIMQWYQAKNSLYFLRVPGTLTQLNFCCVTSSTSAIMMEEFVVLSLTLLSQVLSQWDHCECCYQRRHRGFSLWRGDNLHPFCLRQWWIAMECSNRKETFIKSWKAMCWRLIRHSGEGGKASSETLTVRKFLRVRCAISVFLVCYALYF